MSEDGMEIMRLNILATMFGCELVRPHLPVIEEA